MTPISKAKEWADRLKEKWDNYYTETGHSCYPEFTEFFHAIHDDGSTYTLPNCFVVRYEPKEDYECVVVFTEHQGTFVFASDELLWYARYEHRMSIPKWNKDYETVPE